MLTGEDSRSTFFNNMLSVKLILLAGMDAGIEGVSLMFKDYSNSDIFAYSCF